jgi:hypothetical protein
MARRLADPAKLETEVIGRISVILRGIEGKPPLSLLESIAFIEAKGLISEGTKAVRYLLREAQRKIDGSNTLTADDIAHIMFYTAEDETEPALYKILNETCYLPNRTNALKPFGNYSWGLLNSLKKIPSYDGKVVYRGVRKNLLAQYRSRSEVTWWGCSSTTTSLEVLQTEQFCGMEGDRTIFTIELTQGQAKDITRYSLIPGEREVLLPFCTTLKVKSCMDAGHGLCLIQLEEVESVDLMLDLRFEVNSEGTCQERPNLHGQQESKVPLAGEQSQASDGFLTPRSDAAEVGAVVQEQLMSSQAAGSTMKEVGAVVQEQPMSSHAAETTMTEVGAVVQEQPMSSQAAETTMTEVARKRPDCQGEGEGWFQFGLSGGGISEGQMFSKRECFSQALELDPTHSRAWYNFGTIGGGTIAGSFYNEKQCYQKALEYNPNDSKAWNNLGVESGGLVNGHAYDAQMCILKALDLEPNDSDTWDSLGTVGGGSVCGRLYNKKDCFEKALELNPQNSDAWGNLVVEGGGRVAGTSYDEKHCYQRQSS